MDSRVEDEERVHFSDRLKASLARRGYAITPSAFSAEFNVRADGATVTVHGARKWLVGDAIPTQARIQILANWLEVSAAWLRFGDASNGVLAPSPALPVHLATKELQLMKDIRHLPESHWQVVRDLVDSLLRNAHEHRSAERSRDHQRSQSN